MSTKKLVNEFDKLIEDKNIYSKKQDKTQDKINDDVKVLYELVDSEFDDVITEKATNIHVEDAAKYNKNKLDIFGNLTQNTRNGYNCIDLREFESQTKNGVTVTNDEGRLTLNGTTTQATGLYTNVTEKTIKAGTYTNFIIKNDTVGTRMTVSLRL